ncbi:MAG: 30S ribosomal protein S4e [Nanoarchaeota archaeon]|nr:30S ribosomal protein S4e [Nanoarchaeota archaeon]
MVKRHLSRLAAPTSWPIKRKGMKWITRPNPGPHTLKTCISLNLVIKNILKYAKTTKEVKKILDEGKVLVDKKMIKDYKFPVGVMDILEIPETKEYFKVLYNTKGKFIVVKISSEEAKLKIAKITGKTILKGKKIQLNFYNGRNLLVDKDSFKVGDTLILSMGDKVAVKKHIQFEKGALVYLIEGKYKGMSGKIEDIKPIWGNPIIKVKSKDKSFETSKHFALAVDSSVSLGENK